MMGVVSDAEMSLIHNSQDYVVVRWTNNNINYLYLFLYCMQ